MAASNTFGVTTTTVYDEQLSSLVGVDEAKLEQAIDAAASVVCQELTGQNISTVGFTSSADADGFTAMHTLVSVGAAFFYIRNTSGDSGPGTSFENQWAAGLSGIRRRPNQFRLYNPNAGANTMTSHMTDKTDAEIERLRERLEKPERSARSWNSL